MKEIAERIRSFHNPARVGVPEIFLFFARNLLKSPNSEKYMKRNESDFAFILLLFLCVNSLSGCIRGRRDEPIRSRAGLFFQLAVPVEIIHPTFVQIVRREEAPVLMQVVDGRLVGLGREATCAPSRAACRPS